MDDGFQMQFFGGYQRETFLQIEAHLVAEHTDCARSRAVILSHSFRPDAVEQIKILFHIRFARLIRLLYSSQR